MLKANLVRKLPTKSPYIVHVYTCRDSKLRVVGQKMEGRNLMAGCFLSQTQNLHRQIYNREIYNTGKINNS